MTDLLELLTSGARPAYEALIGIVCVDEAGNDLVWRIRGKGLAGPDTTAGVCRRWWDAASGAGEAKAADVAADVLGLHLDAMQVQCRVRGGGHLAWGYCSSMGTATLP